ncbi:MAG TPA: glucokinase, partial [Minicystis sp.]|nr:glucokinase [Minicystis sp.]
YELGHRKPVASVDAESRAHSTFDAIVVPFVEGAGASPDVAVIGVAGPIRDGAATITNLPWRLEERALAKKLGARRVRLANDLVVAATGCLHLHEDEIVPLTPARPSPHGKHCAVIAAGTGLGEARLLWTGARHVALATEGGHCDFAPRTPLEIELWHFLHERHPDHVSYERVVCGDGLGALYDFFAARAGHESASVTRRLAQGDRNAAIAELGLARASRPAARAVELFASIYGAEAGNLALRELALGGVFVVGNIARHLVPARRELFLDAFCMKGRFSALMDDIPVCVVGDPALGVRGALAMAAELVAEG